MNYDFLIIYNDFFTNKITFLDFMDQMDDYLKCLNYEEAKYFNDYIIDNSFTEYNPDMVMLTYIYLWLFPNKINKEFKLIGADNMYLNFLKAIITEMDYQYKNISVVNYNLNYIIYLLNDTYLIINITNLDININLPSSLINKKVNCINCNESYILEDKIKLYPYGFYLFKLE